MTTDDVVESENEPSTTSLDWLWFSNNIIMTVHTYLLNPVWGTNNFSMLKRSVNETLIAAYETKRWLISYTVQRFSCTWFFIVSLFGRKKNQINH